MGQLADILNENGCFDLSMTVGGKEFRRYVVPKPWKETGGISKLKFSELDGLMQIDGIDCIIFAEKNFYICEISRSGDGRNFTAMHYPYEHFISSRTEDWFRIRDFLQPSMRNSEIYF